MATFKGLQDGGGGDGSGSDGSGGGSGAGGGNGSKSFSKPSLYPGLRAHSLATWHSRCSPLQTSQHMIGDALNSTQPMLHSCSDSGHPQRRLATFKGLQDGGGGDGSGDVGETKGGGGDGEIDGGGDAPTMKPPSRYAQYRHSGGVYPLTAEITSTAGTPSGRTRASSQSVGSRLMLSFAVYSWYDATAAGAARVSHTCDLPVPSGSGTIW